MASEPRNIRKPEQKNFRIWPGILVIALCVFLLFAAVYIAAFRASLVSMPTFFTGLFGAESENREEAETANTEQLLPEQENGDEAPSYYIPSLQSPFTLLDTIPKLELYHQRMRFFYVYDGTQKIVLAEVYVRGDCWKLVRTDMETGFVQTTVCDGNRLYRENATTAGDTVITPVGGYTLNSILGLPSLETLKEQKLVFLKEEEKSLVIPTPERGGLRWECMVALDTGMLMQAQLMQRDTLLVSMFTELFDMAPAECNTEAFFTIPEIGGLEP